MKISLTIFCIVTLLLLLCSFEVDASKKCKKNESYNAKTKKCGPKKAAAKGTTAAPAGAAGAAGAPGADAVTEAAAAPTPAPA